MQHHEKNLCNDPRTRNGIRTVRLRGPQPLRPTQQPPAADTAASTDASAPAAADAIVLKIGISTNEERLPRKGRAGLCR